MEILGDASGLLLVLAILLLLGPGVLYLASRNRSRPLRHGLDHSLARSSLPELSFRKPDVRDIDQIVTLAREPATMAANRWGVEDADKHEAFLRSDRFDSFALVSLVAELTSGTREIVGVGSLDLRVDTTDPAIGIHVAVAHAAKGFGTELMSAMISLTQRASPGSIWVGTAVDNHAMQTVMSKLGYEPAERATAFEGSDGSTVNAIWYQVGTRPS